MRLLTAPPVAAARVGRVKRFGYLMFLTPPLLPWIGMALALWLGAPNVFAFFTFFYVYALIPALDALIGQDPVNPADHDVRGLSESRYYRWLTYACLPILAVSLTLGAWGTVHLPQLDALGRVGFAASHGLIASVLGINAAHEMIHKRSALEQRLGGILLAMVCYGGFKIEHVRGHHLNVSTPADPSSARLGQSLYHFLPRAIFHNVTAAYRLEAERLRRKGLPVVSRHNEFLRWYALSASFALGFYLWLGWMGLAFFLFQSLVAIATLETVNYLEHYGLRRRRRPNGRYERTTHEHSWNSNYLLTNLLLFQLQRHSDHHEFPRRRYQVLRHIDRSPQLPAGYATMMLLAWLPPLWRRVMDPRVRAYYRDEPELLAG